MNGRKTGMTKKVYLDQNHWINLLRARKGLSNDTEIQNVLQNIIKASNEGTAFFPISNIHLMETYKKRNPVKRDEMLDFMIEVSQGYAIVPYINIQNFEIRQAVLKQVGLPYKNVIQYVIGKGIPYIMGKKPEIINKDGNRPEFPKDLQDKIREAIYDIEAFKLCVKNNEYIKAVREHLTRERALVKKIENRIKRDMDFVKDKKLRKEFTLLRLFQEIIIPEMEKVAKELCLDPWEIMPPNVSKKRVYDFIQNIPSLYTSWILQFRRDVQCQGKIKPSDINDIAALSMAIPYCDIVVTENMWADIAKKEKLVQLYNTTILDSLSGLNKYL